MCVYVSFTYEYISCANAGVGTVEGDGSTGDGITDGYDPPHMGVGNRI